jgi:hypothetical protein
VFGGLKLGGVVDRARDASHGAARTR